jgi:hypothetical protein
MWCNVRKCGEEIRESLNVKHSEKAGHVKPLEQEKNIKK